MQATIDQITHGVAAFLRDCVAPKINDDALLKVGVLIAAKRIDRNPQTIKIAIDAHPVIGALVGIDESGEIDIEELGEDIGTVVTGVGGVPIEIAGHILTFTTADIEQLIKCINMEAMQ